MGQVQVRCGLFVLGRWMRTARSVVCAESALLRSAGRESSWPATLTDTTVASAV